MNRPTMFGLVAIGGCAAATGAAWLAAHQPSGRPTEPGLVLDLVVGVSLFCCGLASWHARPENRTGLVMVLTGFAWFAGELVNATAPWLYTVGLLVQSLWVIGLLYLLLSFPSGQLRGRSDRWLLWSGIGAGLGFQLLAMLYGNRSAVGCPGCTHNLIDVVRDNRAAQSWLGLRDLLALVVILSLIAVLVGRWRQASAPQRRAVLPVLVTGFATLAALIWNVSSDLIGSPLGALPADVWFYAMATVPIAIMFGFLQRRLARGLVAGLVVELGDTTAPGDLRSALARTLGDPSLQLAYWFPAERCYVDGDGRAIQLPQPGESRCATFVEHNRQPMAVLLHDPALEHNAQLVQSVCAAASLALENERLQAELRARLVELQASRARLVEATDVERRRIERDLHDGTQQRLVSVAMALGLLDVRLPDSSGQTRPLLAEARETLATALQELRDLTHGINPPLLVERGLAPALEELCHRATLTTRIDLQLPRRLPEKVEGAAYFFVSEALANAGKHSHGSEVQVRATEDGTLLRIEVSDDGIGGASASGGSGIVGLSDRIEALGGRMYISSPLGRGTRLCAELPCG